MKTNILYCAADHGNSKIQLSRILDHLDTNKYNIKVAAYKKSSPKNINIDWTLDCLYHFYKKTKNIDSEYFNLYFNQVKSFKPDLIISDLEEFSTYIGNELGCSVWQCSSSLLDFAISRSDKHGLGISGSYSGVIRKQTVYTQLLKNITLNSEKNLVYSHFVDVKDRPKLINNCEWVRPYFVLGEESEVCKHNVIGAVVNKNINIISFLKKYNDSVLFCDYEDYGNKDLDNEEEFACNLKNCNFFVCGGETSFLADAFYNNKSVVCYPNLFDNECIINSLLSNYYGLCSNIYSKEDDFKLKEMKSSFNSEACFFHELL